MNRTLIPVTLLLAALTACGGSTTTDSLAPPSPSSTLPPLCDDVVKAGLPITKELAENGCTTPDGGIAVLLYGDIASYDDRFYGTVGGVWIAGKPQ